MLERLSVDGMDWGMVDRSMDRGVVDRHWVWGRFVGRSWVGHTLVLDIGDIPTIAMGVSLVVDNLGAAIWESHSV